MIEDLKFEIGGKPVLDACCGSRMFWFDKHDARTLFVDSRRETHVLNRRIGERPEVVRIDPDVRADFRELPFPSRAFSLVVFDPPHLVHAGPNGWQAKKYGRLGSDWREYLHLGFRECFRVLRTGGTLIFKWNETDVRVSEILKLTPAKPLFGNRCGKSARSHWIVFLK